MVPGSFLTDLHARSPVTTGFQMRRSHPDGLTVEDVQHTAAAERYSVVDL